MSKKRLRLHIIFVSTVLSVMLGTSYILAYKIKKTLPKITIPDPRELFPEKITFTGTLVNDKDSQPLPGFDFRFKIGENVIAQAESDEAGYFEIVLLVRNNITYKNFKNIANGNFTIRIATGDTNVFIYRPNKKFFDFREIYKKGSLDSNGGTKYVMNLNDRSASMIVGSTLMAQANNFTFQPVGNKVLPIGEIRNNNFVGYNTEVIGKKINLIVRMKNHPLAKTPFFDNEEDIETFSKNKNAEKIKKLKDARFTLADDQLDSTKVYGVLGFSGGFSYERNATSTSKPEYISKGIGGFSYPIRVVKIGEKYNVSMVVKLGIVKVTDGIIDFEFNYGGLKSIHLKKELSNDAKCENTDAFKRNGFNFASEFFTPAPTTCWVDIDLAIYYDLSSKKLRNNSNKSATFDAFNLAQDYANVKIKPYVYGYKLEAFKNSVLCVQLRNLKLKDKKLSYLFKKSKNETKFIGTSYEVGYQPVSERYNSFTTIHPGKYLIEPNTDEAYGCNENNGIVFLPEKKHNIIEFKVNTYQPIWARYSMNNRIAIATFKYKFEESIPGGGQVLENKSGVSLGVTVATTGNILTYISANNRLNIRKNPVITTDNILLYFDAYHLKDASPGVDIPEMSFSFLTSSGLVASGKLKASFDSNRKLTFNYTNETLKFKTLIEPIPITLSMQGEGKAQKVTVCLSNGENECDDDEKIRVCNNASMCEDFINKSIGYTGKAPSTLTGFHKDLHTYLKKWPYKLHAKFFIEAKQDELIYPGQSHWTKLPLRSSQPTNPNVTIDLNGAGLNIKIKVVDMMYIKPMSSPTNQEQFLTLDVSQGSMAEFSKKPFDELKCISNDNVVIINKFYPQKMGSLINLSKEGCFKMKAGQTYDDFIEKKIKVDYISYGFVENTFEIPNANAPVDFKSVFITNRIGNSTTKGAYIVDLDSRPMKIYDDQYRFQISYECTPLKCELKKAYLLEGSVKTAIANPQEFILRDMVVINKKVSNNLNRTLMRPTFDWFDEQKTALNDVKYKVNGSFHPAKYLALRFKENYSGKAFVKNINVNPKNKTLLFTTEVAGISVEKQAYADDKINLCALGKAYPDKSKDEIKKIYGQSHSAKGFDEISPSLKKSGIKGFKLFSTLRGGKDAGSHCSGAAFDIVQIWGDNGKRESMCNKYNGCSYKELPLAKTFFNNLTNSSDIFFTLSPWRMHLVCKANHWTDKRDKIEDAPMENNICKNYSNEKVNDVASFKKYSNYQMVQHRHHMHVSANESKAENRGGSMFCGEEYAFALEKQKKITETDRKKKLKEFKVFQNALKVCGIKK